MAEPLLAPIGGVPALIETSEDLGEVFSQLKSGSGPIAIDAERASGYKYSARAYLIQIKRRGGGLHLIDPIAVGTSPYWAEMSEAFSDQEWIIHASTQDLACLREVGIDPKIIFDTELAGRIAEQIEVDSISLLTVFRDRKFLLENNFDEKSILCIFIPNSYEVYWNVSAEKLRDKMLLEFKTFWNNERVAKAKNRI